MTFEVAATEGDLRSLAEKALRRYATEFLPVRTRELAAQHGLAERLRQVSVRNQRTRWGSCSPRGLVCLNWRLIQTPPSVRDYVILHELSHLRHLDHSPRFWAEVARLCPDYPAAEAWLKKAVDWFSDGREGVGCQLDPPEIGNAAGLGIPAALQLVILGSDRHCPANLEVVVHSADCFTAYSRPAQPDSCDRQAPSERPACHARPVAKVQNTEGFRRFRP